MGCCDRCAYRACADGRRADRRRAAISIGTVATAAVVAVTTAICVTAVITVATAICVAAVIMRCVIMFARRVRTRHGGDSRGMGGQTRQSVIPSIFLRSIQETSTRRVRSVIRVAMVLGRKPSPNAAFG